MLIKAYYKGGATMDLYEIFRDLMDQIYYPGYTEEILEFNYDLFTFEFNQFKKNYC